MAVFRAMKKHVTLTEESLSALNSLKGHPLSAKLNGASIPLKALLAYLKTNPSSPPSDEEEALKALLLADLTASFAAHKRALMRQKTSRKDMMTVAMLITVGIFGMVESALWGFDGIYTVFNLFTTSKWLIVAPSILFSAVSIFIFVGFDFFQGAEYLGVDFFEEKDRLEALMAQERHITQLLKSVDKELLACEHLDELNRLIEVLDMVEAQYQQLKTQKAKLNHVRLSKPYQSLIKTFSACCGILYLCDGYFTGQAGAMYILGASSMGAAMSTPIGILTMVSLGAISAIGAFAFYYLVQRQGVEQLFSRMLGFNQEKVEAFTDEEHTADIDNTLADKKSLLQLKRRELKATSMLDRPVTPKIEATVGEGLRKKTSQTKSLSAIGFFKAPVDNRALKDLAHLDLADNTFRHH